MEIKDLAEIAKQHVVNVFGEELAEAPSLEEIWFDGKRKHWCVTLGLVRGRSPVAALRLPEFKTVRIADGTGELISIRNREFSAA